MIAFLSDQPLLQIALLSAAAVLLGGVIRESLPALSVVMRFIGNLGVIVTLSLTLVTLARNNGLNVPLALETVNQPDQTVSGRETRVPLGSDGHFWVKAVVNGAPIRFLVDTGATLTTLSPGAADLAAIRPKRWGEQVTLNTANGTTMGDMASIDQLKIGNVSASNLDAVVAPGLGDTNVLGMNFLSRLASWRVEGSTLILVPHHPAALAEADPAPMP